MILKKKFSKIIILCSFVLLYSCDAVKRVKDGDFLLTKNTIYENDKKIVQDEVQNFVYPKPNSTLLGIPLRLHIYNLARPNIDSILDAKYRNPQDPKTGLKNFLSLKQYDAFVDSKKDFNTWLKKTGEAPVTINESEITKTKKVLKEYYNSYGYFNSSIHSKINPAKKEKRAAIKYYITTKEPYFLDTITKNIASAAIDSIYTQHQKNSFIKKGQQYNLRKLNAERERLTNIFNNTGIYKFEKSNIRFEMVTDTTAAKKNYNIPVEVQITNPTERRNDSLVEAPYKIHHIKKVNIYPNYNFNQSNAELDSINHDNYTIYYKNELHYRPKAITDVIHIYKDDIYRAIDRNITIKQINNLQTFKYPNIDYQYAKNDTSKTQLETNIYLTPRKRFSVGFNTDVSHSNIQDFGVSFSTSLIARNVFRGAETLEIAARGTIGSQKQAANADDRFFNISEIGGDIKLNFPRIFSPFNTQKIIPTTMFPQTRIALGASVQENIGLDKRNFNGVFRYRWEPSTFKQNNFELLNIQFVRNLNIDNFFNIYQNTYQRLNDIAQNYVVNPAYLDSDGNLTIPNGSDNFIDDVLDNTIPASAEDDDEVQSINERKIRLTNNNLIFASNFTYTRNNKNGILDNDFSQIKAKIELAGNTLSAVANLFNVEKNTENKNLVFGVPYSQYVKTEFDYIKHWQLSEDNILAFRSFFGIAIPYGNSDNIPFSRSYFAGGSNDNRAWEAYSLGPGSTSAVNDFNEANLKLAFNLEYRFPIFSSFKGALFTDAGNIWNVLDNVDDDRATFNRFSSLQDIALGSGFGLRYDFNFFLIRFDIGFKTYDPAYETNRRWFTDYNFANAVYNIGINYPF